MEPSACNKLTSAPFFSRLERVFQTIVTELVQVLFEPGVQPVRDHGLGDSHKDGEKGLAIPSIPMNIPHALESVLAAG